MTNEINNSCYSTSIWCCFCRWIDKPNDLDDLVKQIDMKTQKIAEKKLKGNNYNLELSDVKEEKVG